MLQARKEASEEEVRGCNNSPREQNNSAKWKDLIDVTELSDDLRETEPV